MINKQIISLTNQLISIPSTKDKPEEMKKVLQLAKKQLSGFTVELFEKNNSPSLLAYTSKTRPKKCKIILNAHLDVVPGKESQYQPKIIDNKLYGRGAIDMKAAAAVQILIFKHLAKKVNYPLALQLVTDEETGGFNGTKYQLDNKVKADFALTGEATNLKIVSQSKGVISLIIKAKGKTSHGSRPWEGKNALNILIKAINIITKKYPIPSKEVWKTTCNLAWIKTNNQTFNKVPDNAQAQFDIRYIPQDKNKIIPQIKKLLPKGLKLIVNLNEPAQLTNPKNSYVIKLSQAIKSTINKTPAVISQHGASDIRHFNSVNINGVVFGPKGKGIHSDNEYVNISSLKQYYLSLKQFLLNI